MVLRVLYPAVEVVEQLLTGLVIGGGLDVEFECLSLVATQESIGIHVVLVEVVVVQLRVDHLAVSRVVQRDLQVFFHLHVGASLASVIHGSQSSVSAGGRQLRRILSELDGRHLFEVKLDFRHGLLPFVVGYLGRHDDLVTGIFG